MKRLIRWLKCLLSQDYLIELAEMYLASGKISPEDAIAIRLLIKELQKEEIEKAIKKEIKRKLRQLLARYLEN